MGTNRASIRCGWIIRVRCTKHIPKGKLDGSIGKMQRAIKFQQRRVRYGRGMDEAMEWVVLRLSVMAMLGKLMKRWKRTDDYLPINRAVRKCLKWISLTDLTRVRMNHRYLSCELKPNFVGLVVPRANRPHSSSSRICSIPSFAAPVTCQ